MRNIYCHKTYFVYILSNKNNTTFYIGVTNDLMRRVYEHKSGQIEGFSKKYNTDKLVYYEETSDINIAIEREKQLKRWSRKCKENLIKSKNPKRDDLFIES